MRTIIAGSRSITQYEELLRALSHCHWEITEVVSGGAQGVDLLGELFARKNNLPITRFNPDWDKYGKRAGFLRNQQMAEYAQALVAVWDGCSKGTEDMVRRALEHNLVLIMYNTSTRSIEATNPGKEG